MPTIRHILKNHKKELAGAVIILVFGVMITALAVPPATKYSPGETLNPSCAPGSTNCSVDVGGGVGSGTNDTIPAYNTAGDNIEDGTWAFSGNDIYPLTTGSNIGTASKRIDTIYLSSILNYDSNLSFSTTSSTKMTLTTDGKLGIGTTAPSQKLHIFGTNPRIFFDSDDNGFFGINFSHSSGVAPAQIVYGGGDITIQPNTGGLSAFGVERTSGSTGGDTLSFGYFPNSGEGLLRLFNAKAATAGDTLIDSPTLRFQNSYWDGGAGNNTFFTIVNTPLDSTGESNLNISGSVGGVGTGKLLTLDTDGNVGIGLGSFSIDDFGPASLIVRNKAANTYFFRLWNSGGNQTMFVHDTGNTTFRTYDTTTSNKALTLLDKDNNELFSIKGDGESTLTGKLGIGITADTNHRLVLKQIDTSGSTSALTVFNSTASDTELLFLGNGNFGLGTGLTPSVKFHLKQASSGGASIFSASLQPLVIENSDHTWISILSPNDKQVGLLAADPENSAAGEWSYDHNTDAWRGFVQNSVKFYLDATGMRLNANLAPSAVLHVSGTGGSPASAVNIDSLPTSPPAGGTTGSAVCIDSSGNLWKDTTGALNCDSSS